MMRKADLTRREFVATASAAAAAMALPAHGSDQDPEPIRFGLVGCGGRGTGAAENCLHAAKNVRMVAMADLFQDRLERSRGYLAGKKFRGFEVDDDHCFTGFDAYRRLIDADVDLVLFATPPGFRPLHVEAAVEAGKHVFMEKPVAVDPVGVRRIFAAGEKAKEKGLALVAGTQYRHQDSFVEGITRVRGGAIGRILSGRCYYNTGELWHRGSKKDWSPMEYQIRNWYYFCWLSGDHIVEQHIHTIDVVNWTMGAHPVRAVGMGGRQKRTAAKYGNIYDHFAVDYEYPDDVHVLSLCRQMSGTEGHVGAGFDGTKGFAAPYSGVIRGEKAWKYRGKKHIGHAYVQELADLINSVRAGKPLNEARQVAESTLTAILGREAAYTGRMIGWDEIAKSDLDLSPPKHAFGPIDLRPVPRPGRKR